MAEQELKSISVPFQRQQTTLREGSRRSLKVHIGLQKDCISISTVLTLILIKERNQTKIAESKSQGAGGEP